MAKRGYLRDYGMLLDERSNISVLDKRCIEFDDSFSHSLFTALVDLFILIFGSEKIK